MTEHIRYFLIFASCITDSMMKNLHNTILFIAAAAITVGCAKNVSEGVNDAEHRFLNAWLKTHDISDEQKAGRGIYILNETKGETSTVPVTKDGYAIVNYRTYNLEGNISDYTDKETAKQLGTYNPTVYYGPKVWLTSDETIRAGILDGIVGMNIGDTKKFIVPSWLMSYKNYSSENEYLAQASENTTTIYEVTIEDFTNDIKEWEFVQMARKMSETYKPGTTVSDTTSYGYYYMDRGVPVKHEEALPSDTTIYINYTGKLLNGLVFDTSIERVAKDNNLYSSTKTYGPVPVQWAEEYTDITLDASEVISGFSKTLWSMKNCRSGAKGMGMFYSELGYGYSGSGYNIPAYAPLIFEIEFVEAPKE